MHASTAATEASISWQACDFVIPSKGIKDLNLAQWQHTQYETTLSTQLHKKCKSKLKTLAQGPTITPYDKYLFLLIYIIYNRVIQPFVSQYKSEQKLHPIILMCKVTTALVFFHYVCIQLNLLCHSAWQSSAWYWCTACYRWCCNSNFTGALSLLLFYKQSLTTTLISLSKLPRCTLPLLWCIRPEQWNQNLFRVKEMAIISLIFCLKIIPSPFQLRQFSFNPLPPDSKSSSAGANAEQQHIGEAVVGHTQLRSTGGPGFRWASWSSTEHGEQMLTVLLRCITPTLLGNQFKYKINFSGLTNKCNTASLQQPLNCSLVSKLQS